MSKPNPCNEYRGLVNMNLPSYIPRVRNMKNEKLTSNSTTDLTKSIKSGIWYILAAKVSMAVDKMRTALWYAGGHVPM